MQGAVRDYGLDSSLLCLAPESGNWRRGKPKQPSPVALERWPDLANKIPDAQLNLNFRYTMNNCFSRSMVHNYAPRNIWDILICNWGPVFYLATLGPGHFCPRVSPVHHTLFLGS